MIFVEHFAELRSIIEARINPHAFYAEYIRGYVQGKLVLCPLHDDKNPSFKVYEDGGFKCFGCGRSGSGPVKFYELFKNCSFQEAQEELYSKYVEFTVPQRVIDATVERLKGRPEVLERLQKDMGWAQAVLERLEIGLHAEDDRITIPVRNKFGKAVCMRLLNVFHLDGLPRNSNLRKGMTVMVWPLNTLIDHQEILLMEGEKDTLCALSRGFAALTAGGASNRIKAGDLPLFRGKMVVVCFDMDDAGRKGARKMALDLLQRAGADQVKVVQLPFATKGLKDFTDWMQEENHTVQDFEDLVASTPPFKPDMPLLIQSRTRIGTGEEYPFTPIEKLGSGEFFQRNFSTEACVTGIQTSIYMAPRVIEVRCMGPRKKSCSECVFDRGEGPQEITIDPREECMVRLIDVNTQQLEREVKRLVERPRCNLQVTVTKADPVRKLLLEAPVQHQEHHETKDPVQMIAYYFGLNIRPNATYLFRGYGAAHPCDGSFVAMCMTGEAVSTSLDSFVLTADLKKQLEAFCVPQGSSVWDHLMDLYQEASVVITKIRGRPELHMAVDLVFHSPMSLRFAGTFLRKAALDVLVFGDHRCGKGFVAERLSKYYECAEVVSGENITPMNLIGGIKVARQFRGLCWGRLVHNHGGTVIVDEMSALDPIHLGRLSRIRSEGVADVDKDGGHHKALACTGLLWLSNPRDRRCMEQHNHGVEVLTSLMPSPADIARFDYVCAVAMGEVPAREINRMEDHLDLDFRFSQAQCHSLILWIKSRTPDQIVFTQEATELILSEAVRLSAKYHPNIPLVQAENARLKLAKVASAIAGRVFSTDSSGEIMVVGRKHVEAAVRLLETLYDSPTLGYLQYSRVERKYEIADTKALERLFNYLEGELKVSVATLCDFFLRSEHMTKQDVMDILNFDNYQAQHLVNKLIHANAIIRKYQFYVKSMAFIRWLREQSVGKKVGSLGQIHQ